MNQNDDVWEANSIVVLAKNYFLSFWRSKNVTSIWFGFGTQDLYVVTVEALD